MRVDPPDWSRNKLSMRPVSLDYWPEQRGPFPGSGDDRRREEPLFGLTDENGDEPLNEEQFDRRNTLVGFGSSEQLAWLARLLLDIGNPSTERNEFNLEYGGGAADAGVQVRFLLPGPFGWGNHRWDA